MYNLIAGIYAVDSIEQPPVIPDTQATQERSLFRYIFGRLFGRMN